VERPIYTPSFVVLGWNTSGRKVNWTGIGCHPEAGLKMVLLYRFSVSSDICSGHLVIDLFNFQAHGQFTRFHIFRAHS